MTPAGTPVESLRPKPTEAAAHPDTQRRMDALAAVFDKAPSTPPGGTGPKFMLNVVMDWHTYQRELARLCGVDITPDDANRPDFECRTLDGTPLNPTEVSNRQIDHYDPMEPKPTPEPTC
ncbi:MAG: hypothetical protein GY925_29430 [Actinomycetia bacterium]|nr:hypothetical protein [Actinomycetes bacterium]